MVDLPHFVRKQAEKASARLISELEPLDIAVVFKGTRVLVSIRQQHPTKQETITLPMALLDYKDFAWLLLFRGSQGAWQMLPDDKPHDGIDQKISNIINDPYQVFWRQ